MYYVMVTVMATRHGDGLVATFLGERVDEQISDPEVRNRLRQFDSRKNLSAPLFRCLDTGCEMDNMIAPLNAELSSIISHKRRPEKAWHPSPLGSICS